MGFKKCHELKYSVNRVRRGECDKIILDAGKKCNVSFDKLSKRAVAGRLQDGRKSSSLRCGSFSPLHQLEPYFIAMLIERSKMRQPFSPTHFLNLINSLIEGTQEQNDLIAFKKACNVKQTKDELGLVRRDYLRKFYCCYKDALTTINCVMYNHKEEEWSTKHKFQ